MNKILLIGNSGLKHNILDGQTIKTRTYKKKLEDEGCDVLFIDLENIKHHFLSILMKIKKSIYECDRVILLAAQRGSVVLIPYINFINRKLKKPFVLPLVGTSVLHYTIDKLPRGERNDFLMNFGYKNYSSNKQIQKQLKRITYVLPETESLAKLYKDFYHLNNVYTLNNFRDIETRESQEIKHQKSFLSIVFLSRVMREKGIFDIIESVKKINFEAMKIKLDIYGQLLLNSDDLEYFKSLTDERIIYRGTLDNEDVVDTLKKYDVFAFPTRFIGEGTPGVISEALLAGTPVISSDFPQAQLLLKCGVDSLIFKMGDIDDLTDKLEYLCKNREFLCRLRNGAISSGEMFTYKHERNSFLKYVCGIKN